MRNCLGFRPTSDTMTCSARRPIYTPHRNCSARRAAALRNALDSEVPAMTHRTTPNPLLSLTQSFFRDYLDRTRGVTSHTVRAYRDSLKLFFEFLSGLTGRTIAQLSLDDVTSETVKA